MSKQNPCRQCGSEGLTHLVKLNGGGFEVACFPCLATLDGQGRIAALISSETFEEVRRGQIAGA
jgi:hypothetical protein